MIYKFNNEEYDDLRDYLKALKASDNRYNSYKPWTDKEDAELIELSESMSVPQLADHFKRIKGGIRARLSKHAMNNIDIPPESNKFFDAIIKGVDPFTGEFLEDDSVWKGCVTQLLALSKIYGAKNDKLSKTLSTLAFETFQAINNKQY